MQCWRVLDSMPGEALRRGAVRERTGDPGLLDLHGPQAAKVLRLLQIISVVARLGSLLCCLPLLSLLQATQNTKIRP